MVEGGREPKGGGEEEASDDGCERVENKIVKELSPLVTFHGLNLLILDWSLHR